MAGEIVYGLGGRSTTEHGPAAKLGTQNIYTVKPVRLSERPYKLKTRIFQHLPETSKCIFLASISKFAMSYRN